MSKIIGATVGTPTSPKAISEKIKPVTSVNGVTPDKNGNVELNNSSYKNLFTQYGSDDGYEEKGYIAISIPTNSVIEIDIDEDYNAEHSHSYLQLACGSDAHYHRVLVNSNCKVYVDYAFMYSNCTWYIPWSLYGTGVGVSVSARCVSDTSVDYVSGKWVSADSVDTTDWIEITEHYATKDDIGDISSALTELHIYAQALINGGDA